MTQQESTASKDSMDYLLDMSLIPPQTMTENETTLTELATPSATTQPVHVNVLLKTLKPSSMPRPSACEHCPDSLWFTKGKEIQCFCRQMFSISYQEGHDPVKECSGQMLAILNLKG